MPANNYRLRDSIYWPAFKRRDAIGMSMALRVVEWRCRNRQKREDACEDENQPNSSENRDRSDAPALSSFGDWCSHIFRPFLTIIEATLVNALL